MYFQCTYLPPGQGRRASIIPFGLLAAIVICLACTLPNAAFSQDKTGNEYRSSSAPNDGREWSKFNNVRVSKETTDGVAASLRQAARFCDLIPEKAYIFDCYASELKRIASGLSPSGDYADARAALNAAGAEIEKLVKANQDIAKPSLRVRSSGASRKKSARRLKAVTPASVPRVAKEAETIIKRTQTVLLRSTENSDRRRAHYQRIAQSMETGTVMLRSL